MTLIFNVEGSEQTDILRCENFSLLRDKTENAIIPSEITIGMDFVEIALESDQVSIVRRWISG